MPLSSDLVRTVIFVALPLAVACAGPAQVPDTQEARQEGARTIARLSVESGSLREMIDDGAKLAQASTAESLKLELKRELTDAEEEQVLEIFREALAEILTQKEYEEIMIGVIAAHFSAPEMAEALAFYQSPAGAKILRLESALAQEVDAKTDALFDDRLDDFIARVDRELANEFAELREGDEQ
jgi:hypothetical protein